MRKRNLFSFLLVVILAVIMVVGMAACNPDDPEDNTLDLSGTYDIKVWVSEIEGVADLTAAQIDAFEAANPGIVIDAQIEGVSEGESATQMITDVETGADLFCFAQDQLARLVQAGALNPLGQQAAATVRDLNDAGSVAAASVGNTLYCYPLTSDNGYYMYYDKSVISEDIVDSLEDIIAACEAAGRGFSYELGGSGWYSAGFFFGTGCESVWTTNDDGEFVAINDTFNSPAGIAALKGIQKVVKSSSYVNSAKGTDFSAAVPSAVVISGTWVDNDVKAALGDNYGVTDLPSFTVDGQTYHIGSFSGNKLMGVKPQIDAKRAAVLQKLALFLTGEDCQVERFEQLGWGPSNKAAQASEAVQAAPALAALAKQSAYAKPQGQIHGIWWDLTKAYVASALEAELNDTAALQAILDTYKNTIDSVIDGTYVPPVTGWGVVGKINGEDCWNADVAMTEDPAGTWKATLELKAGDELKVRFEANWDLNVGADGALNGGNVAIAEDGTYVITLVDNGDGTYSLTVVKA